jgi:hypothetical protein
MRDAGGFEISVEVKVRTCHFGCVGRDRLLSSFAARLGDSFLACA